MHHPAQTTAPSRPLDGGRGQPPDALLREAEAQRALAELFPHLKPEAMRAIQSLFPLARGQARAEAPAH